MAYRETVRAVVPALMQLCETLKDPTLDAERRAFGEDTRDKAHDFLIERQDALKVERDRLHSVGDVNALAMADFIARLLADYAGAEDAATAVIDQAGAGS